MITTVWALAVSAALGASPYPAPYGPVAGGYGPAYSQGGPPQAMEYANGVPFAGSVDVADVPGTTGAYGAQLYPYDQQDPWLHGYFQEIPAYGGFGSFRPYNYKHVFSQSQTAAGWGAAPTMPYSQQFWHRYHHFATQGQRGPGAGQGVEVPIQPHYSPTIQPPPGALRSRGGPRYGMRPGSGYREVIPAQGYEQSYEEEVYLEAPAANGRSYERVPQGNRRAESRESRSSYSQSTRYQQMNYEPEIVPASRNTGRRDARSLPSEEEIYRDQLRQQRETQRPIR